MSLPLSTPMNNGLQLSYTHGSGAGLYSVLATLISRLEDEAAQRASVIPWGSPVPTFGDLPRARVATLGLNPSNREFVDGDGSELRGEERRFHTLGSLSLRSWADAHAEHLQSILSACVNYFVGNPYDRWFRRLDSLIAGTGSSFYNDAAPACHLDVIPYATARKWTQLTRHEREGLWAITYDSLGLLLRQSDVQVLVLNGQSVVAHFQEATGIVLGSKEMPDWALPRGSGSDVRGCAYFGSVDTISGHRLGHQLLVLGYNHNIQSSFGVTNNVIASISDWIAGNATEVLG